VIAGCRLGYPLDGTLIVVCRPPLSTIACFSFGKEKRMFKYERWARSRGCIYPNDAGEVAGKSAEPTGVVFPNFT